MTTTMRVVWKDAEKWTVSARSATGVLVMKETEDDCWQGLYVLVPQGDLARWTWQAGELGLLPPYVWDAVWAAVGDFWVRGSLAADRAA